MRARFTSAVIVTMDADRRVVRGSLRVEDGRIAAIVPEDEPLPPAAPGEHAYDCAGRALVPGFVQTHVHGCQTLFRGAADDLPLLAWLRRRIWPLEAAHDPESLAASVALTALELLRGGTTAVLTMETVRHTDAAIAAYEATPLRATVGKCMMDRGGDAPAGLTESTEDSLAESLRLVDRHPPRGRGKVRACFAPRFAVSCTDGLLREVAAEAERRGALVHTHACEQREEVALVRSLTGCGNLEHFGNVGLLRPWLRLAHAVHLDPAEEDALAASGAHVLHCPSSNLKLGSGIAPIARYLDRGIPVSLGADGAPCNNNLDGLREARLAALLQKPAFGPQALPAARAFALLTIDGARALGREDEIGSLEVGKRADLVEIDLDAPHHVPGKDPYATLVYAADRADVHRVFVDGAPVVERGEALYADGDAITAEARLQAARLFARAAL